MLLGLVETALVEGYLTDVAHVDGVHHGIAGPVHGVLCPLVQLERLVPLAAEVGEHAEHVEHTRLAREIVELFEQGQGTDPVDRLLQLAELHLGVVDEPERVRERLFVPDRLGLGDRERAPLDGVPVASLVLAATAVPAQDFGPLARRLVALVPLEDVESLGDPAENARIPVEPGLDPRQFQCEARFSQRVVVDEAPSRPVGGCCLDVGARAVPGVAERLVDLGELGLARAASRLRRGAPARRTRPPPGSRRRPLLSRRRRASTTRLRGSAARADNGRTTAPAVLPPCPGCRRMASPALACSSRRSRYESPS